MGLWHGLTAVTDIIKKVHLMAIKGKGFLIMEYYI
jgi:hypothetical protein